MIAVLLQALRTGDEELLNSCVEVGDEKVIHGTVRLLPTRLVLKFLTLLIERFQLQPKEAPFLIPWIKAVLEVHTASVSLPPSLPLPLLLSAFSFPPPPFPLSILLSRHEPLFLIFDCWSLVSLLMLLL